MGFIVFQSLNSSHSDIASYQLEDFQNGSDQLLGYNPGDLFELSLDISQEEADQISQLNDITIKVNKVNLMHQGLGFRHEVIITFVVVMRTHHIGRDWISERQSGFRSYGTTIHVQASTEIGENLFKQLQNEYYEKQNVDFGAKNGSSRTPFRSKPHSQGGGNSAG